MVHLRSLCKPKAARRYGFTNFQFMGENLNELI